MKIRVSMFSFTGDADPGHLFPLVKQAGYDGVGPVPSENGYLNQNTSKREILETKKMVQDTGLGIPGVGVWSLWKNSLVSSDPSIRQKARDIIKKQVECATLMGTDTILVVPGYVSCDFAPKPERIRYDVTYERCVKTFRSLAPLTEHTGVSIEIEDVWSRFLLSPLEMRRLVQGVGSPATGVYFDVGNIMYIGYPGDWIGILGNLIRKIHLSSYRTDQAGLGAFADLFAGNVDFVEVTEALRAVGYNDYLILKMLPNHKQFPEVSIVSNEVAMDRMCGMMERGRMEGTRKDEGARKDEGSGCQFF